jgi:hypothetical protein
LVNSGQSELRTNSTQECNYRKKQGGDPLNRQFNQIEIEAIEVRASIQRQSTEDVFNVNSIHVKAELTLKYVDG